MLQKRKSERVEVCAGECVNINIKKERVKVMCEFIKGKYVCCENECVKGL